MQAAWPRALVENIDCTLMNILPHQCCCLQSSVTGASSGAQEDAVKAEAKVQDLQGRLKIAEQEKAAADKAQKVR